jgi:hypothetical protein
MPLMEDYDSERRKKMVKRKTLLVNGVAALYLLFDTKYRQGYFYVEYDDGKVCESFEHLNDAIKYFDEMTLKLRDKAIKALEHRPGKLSGSTTVGQHTGAREFLTSVNKLKPEDFKKGIE